MSSPTAQREASVPPSNVMAGVPEHILRLLGRLHAESAEQEARIRPDELHGDSLAGTTRDKFIALDQDKAQCVYALCRAIGARTIVEAGTSFGVSTIYLALAAAANTSSAADSRSARVIATEHEPTKAVRAREHWRQCGDAVGSVIELREGDLLETLKDDLGEVDFLLLDIWTPMALPTLQLVQPRMRRGAVIITDNTIKAAEGYKELLNHLRGPASPFINVTLPYSNGLEMSIYLPQ
ncbi:methyltransferase [Hirsutella rhossiliensis]|uniref:Methyltransferase domain-containing protein n=1 Tax=Hirsutella rhossiliensis TaxID=111463 RepID=A0A9P8SD11_9HYPO|nr:methyltransferase domain-containing protein [Hirsutella rhossiliensis]KAH0958233.1 methyltransferase domain-containing protein [Hirsutella rhossiliensis]